MSTRSGRDEREIININVVAGRRISTDKSQGAEKSELNKAQLCARDALCFIASVIKRGGQPL
jgi:hypothetical protein